jgi:hypothetical protein
MKNANDMHGLADLIAYETAVLDHDPLAAPVLFVAMALYGIAIIASYR